MTLLKRENAERHSLTDVFSRIAIGHVMGCDYPLTDDSLRLEGWMVYDKEVGEDGKAIIKLLILPEDSSNALVDYSEVKRGLKKLLDRGHKNVHLLTGEDVEALLDKVIGTDFADKAGFSFDSGSEYWGDNAGDDSHNFGKTMRFNTVYNLRNGSSFYSQKSLEAKYKACYVQDLIINPN